MSSACENYTLYGIMHGKADGCIKREMILCILNKQHSKTISSDKQKKHCSSCIACMVEDMMQRQCQLKHGYVTCNVHGSITVRPYRYLKELTLGLCIMSSTSAMKVLQFLLFAGGGGSKDCCLAQYELKSSRYIQHQLYYCLLPWQRM